MARLEFASQAQVAAIARESHVLWGGGLSFDAYRELWEEVGRTQWSRDHARHVVWRDDPHRILSSMKVYRPRFRLLDQVGRCSVYGAVFTPRALRRRGFASDMVKAGLAASEQRGDLAVLLFSDIGTRFYTDLGFRPLPAFEYVGRILPAPEGAEGRMILRPARLAELQLIRGAHAASSAARPLAILRDAAHWEFLWVRSRSFFARVQGAGVRHEWHIAVRDGEFAGYLISVEGRGEWNLREVGSVTGDTESMVQIVRCAAAAAYRRGCRRGYGWLPDQLAERLGGWSMRRRARRRAVPMLRVGHSSSALEQRLASPLTYIPFQDQF